jgi:hypothetical protein
MAANYLETPNLSPTYFKKSKSGIATRTSRDDSHEDWNERSKYHQRRNESTAFGETHDYKTGARLRSWFRIA